MQQTYSEILDDDRKPIGLTGLEVALVSIEAVANHVLPKYDIYIPAPKTVLKQSEMLGGWVFSVGIEVQSSDGSALGPKPASQTLRLSFCNAIKAAGSHTIQYQVSQNCSRKDTHGTRHFE